MDDRDEPRAPATGGDEGSPQVKAEERTASAQGSLVSPEGMPSAEGPLPAEDLRGLALRVLGGLLLGATGLVLVARAFRAQLEAIGILFVHHFGVAGMFLGTLVADAFSFPVPPQFYLMTLVACGRPQLPGLVAICAATLVAGQCAYRLAGPLMRIGPLRRLVARSQPRVEPIFLRHGYRAMLLASLTPIPFSVLCYLSGIYRVPPGPFGVFLVLRVPRILIFYAAFRLGWMVP
jgi:membrane protein YqaA with SNARE-associated domain